MLLSKTPLGIFLALAMLTLAASAQFNQQKFITYTTTDGLTDNYVMKIATDKKGFTWVATRNGISRFDGLVFTNYSMAQGLRSSWITDVITDNSGTVWFSTEWGLCYYNEATDKFIYLNPKNAFVVLYSGPLFLQGDILWMAAENGLIRVDTKTKKYGFVTNEAIPDPQCITADAHGAVWIGTRGHGFYVWKNEKLRAVHHPSLPADAHLMGFCTGNNILWCATSEGLLKIESEATGMLFQSGPANKKVDALTFVATYPGIGDSMLLCGTYNKRLALFNKQQQRFTQVLEGNSAQVFGLPDAIIHDGKADEIRLWIGSDKGLTMLNPQRQDYTTYLLAGDARFGKSLVKKMLTAEGNVQNCWLLLNNPGAIALYNRFNNQIEKAWVAPAQRFYEAALPMADGSVYLIHQKGIDKFTPASGITAVYAENKQRFYSASAESQSTIWVGTGEGLMRYNLNGKKADYFPCRFTGTTVENNSFTEPFLAKDIAADGDGRVWIASTKYGLFCFNTVTGKLTPFRQPSTAAYETKNRCGSLAFDKNGGLWVGTAAGLIAFDTSRKTFTNYTQAQGLQSSYIYALAVDAAGNITGRGNSGVFRLNIHTDSFTNYPVPVSMSASLLDQEVSSFSSESVVGFEGGFSVYQNTRQNAIPPAVYIINCYAGSERLQGSNYNLHHHQNNLRINYSVVEYASPEAITYRYRLGGNSSAWVNAGTQRSVQLTELPPGSYAFEVMAITTDGRQSKPATVSFIIHPPFWQTAWFITLMSLGAAAVLAWFVRQRIRAAGAAHEQRQRQQQLKLEQYKQQLEAEKISAFFSRSLLDKNTEQEVLDDVTRNLIGELDFENCMIYTWDKQKERLIQQAGVGRKGLLDGRKNPAQFSLAQGEGIVGATVASAQPILVNDTDKDPRYVTLDGERCGSELCVPLVHDKEAIGAINVEQTAKNYFSSRHTQTLTTIATLTAQKLAALVQSQALHQKQLELSQASQKLFETELSLLRSQMNPHFIFNSLNSIQKYIWEAKQEDAAEYLTKFSRLIRFILENSAQKLVSLQREMAALKLYVELEHRRSNQKFDYHLSVDEGLDIQTVQIPPLLLQPYIENAIWHGLNAKTAHGQLTVSIHVHDSQLICLVEDDGIGRRASQNQKQAQHVSMGLNISHQRVQLLQQETGIFASVTVTDKTTSDGKAAGTLITLTLPLIQYNA